MPELPEVEALAAFLRERAAGRVIDRADVAAISVLKTYQPDVTEAGTKKQLAVYLVADPAEVPGVARLGPDPLAPGFTTETLAGLLAGRRTQIKGLLRDQSVIAGIGNAYSDEVLHAARMSPFRLAASLDGDEVAALHDVIVTTLREAVARSAGLAAGDLKAEKKAGLRVHGRAGQPCPV